MKDKSIKMDKGANTSSFYRQIFHLVLPIVIQNLLSAAVSSADVVMLNNITRDNLFDKD